MASLTMLASAMLLQALMPSPVHGDDAARPTAAEIFRVWRQREERTRSFDISWTAHKVLLGPGRHSPDSPGQTIQSPGRFAADEQGRMRMEISNPTRSVKGKILPNSVVQVLSDNGVTLFPDAIRKPYPIGHIDKKESLTIQNGIGGFAVRLFYRPLDKDLGVVEEPAEWTVTPEERQLNGKRCHILTNGVESIWVEDNAARLPLKYSMLRPGTANIMQECTITYKEQGASVWIPATWEFTTLGTDGSVMNAMTAEVTKCLVNIAIPPEEFEIEFPPGTWLRNNLTGETTIIRENAPPRKVLKGEYTGDNYEQLKNSEPPTLSNEKKEAASGGLWLWIGNGVLLAAIAGIWYWRSRSTRANFPDPPNPDA